MGCRVHPVVLHNGDQKNTTSIVCGASIPQSAGVLQFGPWTFVEGFQQVENVRSA